MKARYGIKVKESRWKTQYDQLYAAERQKDESFDREFSTFQEEFKALNRADYLLYEYAKELHQKCASKYSRDNDGDGSLRWETE